MSTENNRHRRISDRFWDEIFTNPNVASYYLDDWSKEMKASLEFPSNDLTSFHDACIWMCLVNEDHLQLYELGNREAFFDFSSFNPRVLRTYIGVQLGIPMKELDAYELHPGELVNSSDIDLYLLAAVHLKSGNILASRKIIQYALVNKPKKLHASQNQFVRALFFAMNAEIALTKEDYFEFDNWMLRLTKHKRSGLRSIHKRLIYLKLLKAITQDDFKKAQSLWSWDEAKEWVCASDERLLILSLFSLLKSDGAHAVYQFIEEARSEFQFNYASIIFPFLEGKEMGLNQLSHLDFLSRNLLLDAINPIISKFQFSNSLEVREGILQLKEVRLQYSSAVMIALKDPIIPTSDLKLYKLTSQFYIRMFERIFYDQYLGQIVEAREDHFLKLMRFAQWVEHALESQKVPASYCYKFLYELCSWSQIIDLKISKSEWSNSYPVPGQLFQFMVFAGVQFILKLNWQIEVGINHSPSNKEVALDISFKLDKSLDDKMQASMDQAIQYGMDFMNQLCASYNALGILKIEEFIPVNRQDEIEIWSSQIIYA